MNIYDIKRAVERSEEDSYFFSRNTMKFFGQTMKDFHIKRLADGRYYIWANLKDRFTGRNMGITERFYNPVTNRLERKD